MTPPGEALGIQRGLGGTDGIPPGILRVDPPKNPVFAPIPEPVSWSLMIVGFGAAGALVRRERRHLRFG
ncbi:MAG: PEPxxWA-CTERM sorting domain-containing protein [Caulobacterales bacterium]|nr:PEPxxWA-CTERM sorting domain-containing protein [Caulobacterales bacterium]